MELKQPLNRSNESNQRIEPTNRIIESNRIDESNQPIEPQNDSKRPLKRPPNDPKRAFGGSWAALGGSWALLGRSWRPSWDQPITRSKTRPSRVNLPKLFGSILEPKMAPKTTPRRPQNESKIKTKNASLFYRSWTRLGPVLRRSWTRLGTEKATSRATRTCIRTRQERPRNSMFSRKNRFETRINPIWPPKKVPKGAQDEPKTSPKRVQNRVQNRSEKMIAKWTGPAGGGGH